MVGIPYFYRLFGYQYAIDQPRARAVRAWPPPEDGHIGRTAVAGDIPAMARLQATTQAGYDLRMPHSPACWRWLVARTGTTHLVVERAGTVVAAGRITPPEEGDVVLGEVAASDAAAALALLAHAAGRADAAGGADGPARLSVLERPGSLAGDAMEPLLAAPPGQAAAYYVRVPDPVALLDHLRPVLSARLAAAEAVPDAGEALVSFFRHHVRVVYADRAVVDVRPGGRMQGPASLGGAGVAPDLVAPLLFGPLGIVGLSHRHPDVYPGPNEAVMAALFPPVRADLLTFYLP
jgi:hypothetical protein